LQSEFILDGEKERGFLALGDRRKELQLVQPKFFGKKGLMLP
jgi:hypothetical protein